MERCAQGYSTPSTWAAENVGDMCIKMNYQCRMQGHDTDGTKVVVKYERIPKRKKEKSAMGCYANCHLCYDGFEVVVCYMGGGLVIPW